MIKKLGSVLLMMVSIFVIQQTASAQTSAFTFQGQLNNGAASTNGSYDFEFLLFDDVVVGTQAGSTITQNAVPVVNGIFAVKLDFGVVPFPAFAVRYLEIHVRQTGGGGFTTLAPRQAVTTTPYAIKSTDAINSLNSANSAQLGGIAANQYLTTTTGIQNTNAAQVANFNINGNGVVGGTLQVISPSSAGLRVQTNTAGGNVASFGGFGAFQIDAPGDIAGRFSIKENGNVGIGISNPAEKLQVQGIIQSALGGYKFPDGSRQTTAANATFINTQSANVGIPSNDTLVSVLHLTLPSSGTYLIYATVQLTNSANNIGQNNNRTMYCRFYNDANADFGYVYSIAGLSFTTATLHSSIPISGSNSIDLKCSGAVGQNQDSLSAQQRRMTAILTEGTVVNQ